MIFSDDIFSNTRVPINIISWFHKPILILFGKIQEVLRINQNFVKVVFSLCHLARLLQLALTMSCSSDCYVSNLTCSGLILPFVLSIMMYLSLM